MLPEARGLQGKHLCAYIFLLSKHASCVISCRTQLRPRLHLQEWTKGRDIGLTMPLWTWLEMEKLCQYLYKGKVRLTLESLRRCAFECNPIENKCLFMWGKG